MNRLLSLLFCLSALVISFDAAGVTKQLFPPNMPAPLNVVPAIPDNFVVLSQAGNLDINEWSFWGPPEVLKGYFKDVHSLSQPIISFRIGMMSQKEVENPDREQFIKNLAGFGIQNFRDASLKWGNYPVYAVAGDVANQSIFIAWVGLNDPQGKTIKFQLLYPEKTSQPGQDAAKLWEDFLNNTKPL